jgi:hypothetical protein
MKEIFQFITENYGWILFCIFLTFMTYQTFNLFNINYILKTKVNGKWNYNGEFEDYTSIADYLETIELEDYIIIPIKKQKK